MKSIRYILSFGILLAILLIIGNTPVAAQLTNSTPPPPPTPGPVPTFAPYVVPKEMLITDANGAIQRVLPLDSYWASREQPLTQTAIASNPGMVMVKQYATRQEAANVYGDGVFVDPVVASEPVWVVAIKGKAYVKSVGIRGATNHQAEASEVIYIISQRTGDLLGMDVIPANATLINSAP